MGKKINNAIGQIVIILVGGLALAKRNTDIGVNGGNVSSAMCVEG